MRIRTRPGLLVMVAVVAALGCVSAGAQFAFNNAQYAIARDTPPPAVWRTGPLNEDFTLVIPWFGDSSDTLPDRNRARMLLTVVDERIITRLDADNNSPLAIVAPTEPIQEVILELGYVPATGAIVGRAVDSTGTLRTIETIVQAPPIADGEHHCLVATYDMRGSPEETGRLSVYLLGESSPDIKGEYRIDSLTGGFKRLGTDARIYIGDPFAAEFPSLRASHSGPIFCAFARRGIVFPVRIEEWWDPAEGPQLRRYFGEATGSEAETIFIYGQTADRQYVKPGLTGTLYAYFDGDAERWTRWLAPVPARFVEPAPSGTPLPLLQPTPVYEPGFVWSGFYRFTPSTQQLLLNPVSGTLPRFAGVLSGVACGDGAVMAWGLGNSRWANTTSVPAAMGSLDRVSRSHLLGLRDARPEYDGGLFVLDLDADTNIQDLLITNPAHVLSPTNENWSRFSYGGSFSALLGPGKPVHLKAEPNRSYTAAFDVRRPAEVTQSIAVLLMRPNGGEVETFLSARDASGLNTFSLSPQPLFGNDAIIDTNTARSLIPDEVVGIDNNARTITVPVGTDAQIGDAVVTQFDDAVNVITALIGQDVDGVTYELEHAWAPGRAPSVGDRVWIGPWSYKLIGFQDDDAHPSLPIRGIRFDYVSGGRVTIVGVGYRELVGDRICYILAGRGGEGQAAQAEMEFSGALRGLAEALGVELFFTGNATQDPGTVEALESQLGTFIDQVELVGTPDIVSGPGGTFFEQSFINTHSENRDGALAYPNWAYFQIQDDFPGMFDQAMAIWRHDPPHPNGRAMLEAGDRWWTRAEELLDRIILPGACRAAPCPGDVNGDGRADASDVFAWVIAYNDLGDACDQNADGVCTDSDFFALMTNIQDGCDTP